MYMFFKSINTCICCSVLVVTYIHTKQRMYMLFNTRCNMNMLFKQINQSTCHLIYFDEQPIYMSLDVFWWTIALPLSLLSSRRPCGHQWNVRQWSTILWRRRCRWWSGCAMHLRRYVSTNNHNLMTKTFVITHKEITLYLSIVSYGIVARGRAAAIF